MLITQDGQTPVVGFTGRLAEELSARETEQVGISSSSDFAYKNDVNRPMLSKEGSNYSKWCMLRGLTRRGSAAIKALV